MHLILKRLKNKQISKFLEAKFLFVGQIIYE